LVRGKCGLCVCVCVCVCECQFLAMAAMLPYGTIHT
jgi:hypothetical protein